MRHEHKKREKYLERLQGERGLHPAEVTELLDLREARVVKNLAWDVQVGRLAAGGGMYVFDERIAAQKREEA